MTEITSAPEKDITTVKLHKKTKERLDKLKVYRRETYDDILQQIIDILNLVRVDPERARAKLISIDRQKAKNK